MKQGVMIGITHDAAGNPVIREPRVLRVGIGVPKGESCYVYKWDGKWVIRYGALDDKGKFFFKSATFQERAACEKAYRENRQTFAVSKGPRKIPFFTFTRRVVTESGEDRFEPDFAAIDAHCETPREIDIIFMGENPYRGEYQCWSASELKCHGDGVDALRVISMGNESFPQWKEAKASGEKYFSVHGCYTGGCPYAQEGGKDRLVCKPMSTLSFQLANDIRLGATAYFASTSIRTAINLSSSLEVIRAMTDQAGVGISRRPMKLVLTPFKTNHKGQPAVHWAASVEMRAQDVKSLRALLDDSAWRRSDTFSVVEEGDAPLQLAAPSITQEFYPDAGEEDDEEPTQPSSAEQATDDKTQALAAKLAAAKEAEPVVPVDAVNEWPERCTKTWLSVLGEPEFRAVLTAVLGTDNTALVNASNEKAVWAKMAEAKNRVGERKFF